LQNWVEPPIEEIKDVSQFGSFQNPDLIADIYLATEVFKETWFGVAIGFIKSILLRKERE
jgi:hypothetical protein